MPEKITFREWLEHEPYIGLFATACAVRVIAEDEVIEIFSSSADDFRQWELFSVYLDYEFYYLDFSIETINADYSYTPTPEVVIEIHLKKPKRD